MQKPFTENDCDEAEAFLLSRIDYERALTVPYGQGDFKLERMNELLARLGNPERQLRIVHIAGTKGKGSTAAMIAAILTASGRRTGLYSSPHLNRVEERIALDGKPCSRETLAALVGRVRPAVEALDRRDATASGSHGPTYFEVLTALAFCHFADQQVDAAVLEVGLGGRLDSTNVCQPAVTAITTISLDHVQQLGKTLAAIAGEKAGIIKPGVPVVSGVMDAEPRGVIEAVAADVGAPLVQLGRDFDFTYHPPKHLEDHATHGSVDFVDRGREGHGSLEGLALGLLGAHQGANAAVALAVLGELQSQGWAIPETAVRRGLVDVRWPARMEVIRRHPTVVIDAAHNVASIGAFLQALDESFVARRRILIFAATREKDSRGMLAQLLPKFDEVILTRYANNPRGVPVDELLALAGEMSPKRPIICPDPAAAWDEASSQAEADDLVAITGSIFIAAEMRGVIERESG